MMVFNFEIRLVSDAILSSGLGTEIVDSLITRNISGVPLLRASHIKGLMRQTLTDSISIMGYTGLSLIRNVFGSRPDEDVDCGAVFSLCDALLKDCGESLIVTRTQINENGVANAGSLRTVELVSVGSVFEGKCHLETEPGTAEDIAVRLALMSIDAIGGSRSRGAGQCLVSIHGEDRSPGILLKRLDSLLKDGLEPRKFNINRSMGKLKKDAHQLFRIEFAADSPICCPETPVKTNFLSSGFSIPSSAVQGAILHKINRKQPDLASACFEDEGFRVWPLQPIAPGAVHSIRVSLTHKVNKNAGVFTGVMNKSWFDDEAIHEDWRQRAPGAPLKSKDGVLLTINEEQVLWKSSSIPRVVSIHNSVSSGSNGLYAIESMAPGSWVGYAYMPIEVAEVFETLVADNPHVSFGKRRSVQGSGVLRLSRIDGLPIPVSIDETIIITQSPILFDRTRRKSLEALFLEIARTWARDNQLLEPFKVWADAGIRFGWNRHRLGSTIGKHSRLSAMPVILPGSVIKFQGKIDDALLERALIRGIGKGRKRGYGSALRHPGIASSLYSQRRDPRKTSSSAREAFRIAVDLMNDSESLPSASQISELLGFYEKGGASSAMNYMTRQKQRSKKYWSDWEETYDYFKRLLDTDGAAKALRYLANMAFIRREEET